LNSTSWLINPEDYFSDINVSIHGITYSQVRNSPTYNVIHQEISDKVKGKTLVCHTHFDRIAMQKVCTKYKLPFLDCTWLDSARIARRAWPEEFGRSGYGLANICAFIDFKFNHHDAKEDATAAAHIVLEASRHCGYNNLEQWFGRVSSPIYALDELEINQDGNLFGEIIVFTGSLFISRGEAAILAAQAGCKVAKGVTKKTTLLVVGDQDLTKLAGKTKSSKHLKAEKLISNGSPIKIISESDLKTIINF
jgi:DNA polymerase-3 subunit epsilon